MVLALSKLAMVVNLVVRKMTPKNLDFKNQLVPVENPPSIRSQKVSITLHLELPILGQRHV